MRLGDKAVAVGPRAGEGLQQLRGLPLEEAAVAAQLLHHAVQPVQGGLAVGEEDVVAHLGITGGQAGEVAEASRGHGGEVIPGGAGAQEGEQGGGEQQGQVADGGRILVVLLGVQEQRLGPHQPRQPDGGAYGALMGVNSRTEAVGAAAEEVCLRVVDPLVLLAGHGVSAHEADGRRQHLGGPLHHPLLGAGGVGDHTALRQVGSDLPQHLAYGEDGRGDDDHAGPLHRPRQVVLRPVDRPHLARLVGDLAPLVVADDLDLRQRGGL